MPGPCRAVDAGDRRLIWLEDEHWLIACAVADAAATSILVEALAGDGGMLAEVGAALVGLTGFLGGAIVYGLDYHNW